MTAPIVFLIDNGSLRPQATLELRGLADALAHRTGLFVEAVSLLHSHKVPADQLDGVPATIVKRRMREYIVLGQREFICLPLFLGPSSAITSYLPQVIEDFRLEYPDLRVRIGAPLAGEDVAAPDPRLAQMLADQVRSLGLPVATKVALVDHGTPNRDVNRVRNIVAQQLAEALSLPRARVVACSMERREGQAYAFNEPLLERLGDFSEFSGGTLILAMFFLLPGRHAGEGGDVADISARLVATRAFERIETTPLLGVHPFLIDLLEDRLRRQI
jgi:hypothetical protein